MTMAMLAEPKRDVMTDKSELLDQLRIERSGSAEPEKTRNYWPWGVGAAVVVAAAALAWFIAARPDAVSVKVAVARPVPSGSDAASKDSAVVEASGYVVARREANIAPKIAGRLEQLSIEEGAHVESGAILAKLDDSNVRAALRQAQGGVQLAEANLAQAKLSAEDGTVIFMREREQAAAGLISAQTLQSKKAQYDVLQTAVTVSEASLAVAKGALAVAQQDLADTVVRAPFSGVITSRAAQPGEIVSPISAGAGTIRTGIGTLVDMDSLEVEVDVNQNFINRLHAGQAATLRLDSYADWKIPAQIIAIVPTASRSKGTVKVRVGFKVKDPRIVPEMGVHVAFLTAEPAAARQDTPASTGVIVPAQSVVGGAAGGAASVFVLSGSTVQHRDVTLGALDSQGQVVLSGLAAGDRVAVGNLDKLRDGMAVRATNL
jgi:RND family efflux transporter MFP subunit